MIKAIKKFVRCEGGNFAILTAGLALPMFGVIAGGLEYAETMKIRDNIQHSSDAAVLAAFNGASDGWGAMQNDARGFFKANLKENTRLGSVQTKLTRKLRGKKFYLSYTVNTKVDSLFGEFNPFGSNALTIKSTAMYDLKTKRPPKLVPNDFISHSKSRYQGG